MIANTYIGISKEREFKMTTKQYWLSPVPAGCDVCKGPFNGVMYDAKVGGPWGNICDPCFKEHKCSLGTGYGQKYEKQDDGKWLKTAG
jgi:hypothetical protein